MQIYLFIGNAYKAHKNESPAVSGMYVCVTRLSLWFQWCIFVKQSHCSLCPSSNHKIFRINLSKQASTADFVSCIYVSAEIGTIQNIPG